MFLLIALAATIAQFIVFKFLYPYPDFFSDSYSYLFAAKANVDINIWPIGYSKFLRLLHFITNSDIVLVSFQYFLIELSGLYFFFTILYFFKPVKTNENILFAFLFLNPLFLYISNYISSDPLFIALSVFWFTQLIWILNRPQIHQIFIQAILLLACFTIQSNAYYYPVITVIVFSLSKFPLGRKVAGALLGLLFIIPFVIHTRNEAYKMTGAKQFSLSIGWMLASNALYMYEYADTAKTLSPEATKLDGMSKRFYSMMNRVDSEFHSGLPAYEGNFFISHPFSPLQEYMEINYKKTDEYSMVQAWGKCSIIFSEYGIYLIKHNPVAYFREFMVPNVKNFFLPPLEKMKVYNQGENNIEPIAKSWFRYKTTKVTSISYKAQGTILYIFTPLFMLISVYLAGMAIVYWIKDKHKFASPAYKWTFFSMSIFLFLNFCYCLFVSGIVYRFQIFPLIISLAFSLLLTEINYKKVPSSTIA
ncbi:hypothetical protein GCM10022209_47370 [Chitinophaga oryziterrae]